MTYRQTTPHVFEQTTRIGGDACFLDQSAVQSAAACSYMTQNYFARDCTMRGAIQFATMQPGMMVKGSHQLASGGCNVDMSTELLHGQLQAQPKSQIDLTPRPFLTVPYLGRGAVNPVVEAQLMQGEQHTNRKSIYPLSEKSQLKYHTTPLLPELKDTIANPERHVESAASKDWIRGGLPSREWSRQGGGGRTGRM